MEHENNIVHDSYYLVNLFVKDDNEITQLQVQKLMYFFEAYYMNVKDCEKLYDCSFNAWMFGPVAIPLYKEYKSFGEFPIALTEEKANSGNEIDEEKKIILDELYTVFGKLSARELVDLTHMKDSPWYNKWNDNNKRVVYGEQSYISKEETKKWFRENFIVNESD